MSVLDLSPFFSGDEFNSAACYTDANFSHPSSLSKTFNCYFDNATPEKTGKFSPQPWAMWQAANTPNISRGAKVTIGDTVYTVQEYANDGIGLLNVLLEVE